MKKELNAFLNDLYDIDPELRKNEKELIPLLQKLMESKPSVKADETFVKELRERLAARAEILSEQAPAQNRWNAMFARWAYAFGGGAVFASVLLAGLLSVNGYGPFARTKTMAFESTVTELPSRAFGNLKTGAGQSSSTKEFAGMGMGMSGGLGAGSTVGQAMDLRIANPTQYKYVYKGDPIELKDTTVKVYNKTSKPVEAGELAKAAQAFSFSLLDLQKLQGMKMENVTLVQDQTEGYRVFINFMEKTVSLSPNWQKWDFPAASCQPNDQACYNSFQLKPKDLPSDEALIAIAQNFIDEYKINLSAYGKPVIQKYWEQVPAGVDVYIPEEVTLTFPLVLDGKAAMDNGGHPAGLNMSINVRKKKVSGVDNLSLTDYEVSSYEAETDTQALMKIVENGGLGYMLDPNLPTKEIELGAPETVMLQTWSPISKKGETGALWVPALRFPVTKKPTDDPYFFQQSVVVPLAKDLMVQPDMRILEMKAAD